MMNLCVKDRLEHWFNPLVFTEGLTGRMGNIIEGTEQDCETQHFSTYKLSQLRQGLCSCSWFNGLGITVVELDWWLVLLVLVSSNFDDSIKVTSHKFLTTECNQAMSVWCLFSGQLARESSYTLSVLLIILPYFVGVKSMILQMLQTLLPKW